MTDADTVRALYQAYQDRAWERVTPLLHPQAVVDLPATAERLEGREAVMDFQRAYPEPWGTMTVHRVLSDDDGAAAEISVVDPAGRRFCLAAFWRMADGLLHHGTEYWSEAGADTPPPSRAQSAATRAARQAGSRATGERPGSG
jgi:ketosteroid isomerase-like protein